MINDSFELLTTQWCPDGLANDGRGLRHEQIAT